MGERQDDDPRRARLRAYLDTWPDDPPPVPGECCPKGAAADLDLRPAPDPHNGGITPGYEAPGDPDDVEQLRAQVARLLVEINRLKAETWELAGEVLRLRRQNGGGGDGADRPQGGGRREAGGAA